MKKKDTVLLSTTVIILLVLVLLFYNFSSIEYHTCIFNKQTLDLECSDELRIWLGYERFLTDEPIKIGNNTVAYHYDEPIYSEESKTNLNEIYKSSEIYITNQEGEKYKQCVNCPDLGDQEPSAFFTNSGLYKFRRIRVMDIETNQTFRFYLRESGEYNVEDRNTVYYSLDMCNAGGSLFCMQEWRCWRYSPEDKACLSLMNNKTSDDICYELENSDLRNYCLEN